MLKKRQEYEECEDMDISSPKRQMNCDDHLTAGLAQQASREQWNCRGLGNLRTVRALKKLLFDKDPGCVFLSETRKKDSEMNYFRNMHGYTNVFAVSCIGEGRRRAGVLALLWKHDIEVDIKLFSKNHIDFFISLEEGEEKWRCTGVYGYSDTQSKHKTCELIEQLAGTGNTDKWMLMGDFNLVRR